MSEICTDCCLYKTSCTSNGMYSINKLMGTGGTSPKVMFVMDFLTEDELKSKVPFSNMVSQLLKKAIRSVGVLEEDSYFTYLVKCKPDKNHPAGSKEITTCLKYLEEEIQKVKPKVIVALGGTVANYLGVSGSISQINGQAVFSQKYDCHILSVFHPLYINNYMDQSKQKKEWIQDLGKIVLLLSGKIEQKQEVVYKIASSIQEVTSIVDELLKSIWVSYDSETSGLNYFKDKILLTSFSNKVGYAYVIPYLYPGIFSEEEQKQVKFQLERILSSNVLKIMQNGKFDIQFLFTAGITIKNFAFDTMLAHALLDENSLHGLNTIVPIYTDMDSYKDEVTDYIKGNVKILNKGIIEENKGYWEQVDENDPIVVEALKKKSTTYKRYGSIIIKRVYMDKAFRKSNILDCPYDKLAYYAAQDADATFRLFLKLYSLLEQENLLTLLMKTMVPLSSVLAKMEYEGIGGDLEYTKGVANRVKKELEEAKFNILKSKEVLKYLEKYSLEKAASLTPVTFNPNSPDQKAKLFFDIMGLKPVGYNKLSKTDREKGLRQGSPKTDAPSIKLLLAENKVKVLEDFIKLGQVKKLCEYMEEYQEILETSFDGRIHTSFNQIKTEDGGTSTGRLSSNGPNLQNIPIRDPERAKLIRTVFKAKSGYTFIESDYSQIEYRILAHCSGDKKMIEFLNDSKGDIHTKIASQVYRIREDQVNKTLRESAKRVVYGLLYGMSSWTIAKQHGMSEDEVNRFVSGFFRGFPQATKFIDDNVLLMEKQGYLVNMFSRRRRALGIYSRDKKEKESAQRQARNFALQSGAADLVFTAMIKLYRVLLNHDAKMLVQIHDSLIVEIRDDQLDIVIPIIKNTMENAYPLLCKTPVNIKIGKTLGEVKAWEEKENK